MAIGDVYQFKVSMQLPNIGDEALNIYFYQHVAGSSDLTDVINEFNLTVGLPQRLGQTVGTKWRYIEAVNLFDPSDFARVDFVAGTNEGALDENTAPPGVAINFTLLRSSRLVRNGSKRIGGTPSNSWQGGQITSGAYIALMQDMADGMKADIEEPVGDAVFTPVIVKRIKTANPDYPATSKYPFIYSLPTAPEDAVTPAVRDVKFSLFASSQVTRKTNR